MNHAATSREALLQASLSFAAQEGLRSLNIRSIAGACGVSVGCVYRYFPSKAALISATVGKIWEHIFHMTAGGCAQDDFRSCVSWVFACIRNGCQEYPSFFRQHADAFSAGERQDGAAGGDRGVQPSAIWWATRPTAGGARAFTTRD